jgi:hypothetical protein
VTIKAKLVIPPVTELRIRYWWMQDTTVRLSSLLQVCLKKGLPFRLLVPEERLPEFRPQGLLLDCNRPAWLDNTDPAIRQARNETSNRRILEEYRRNVTGVLHRPHARRFLAEGGLLWRIAIAFGPPSLYTEALAGPSPTVTIYGRRSFSGSHVDDLLMPTEIALLLGTTDKQQSFWPPVDLFQNSQHFNGEWSAANEEWFRRQLQRINSGDISALHAHKQWKTHFRRKPVDVPSAALGGTPAHAQDTLNTLLSLYPDVWDSYNATNIFPL